MAIHKCKNCNKNFKDNRSKATYCSRQCFHIHKCGRTCKYHPDKGTYCKDLCKICYNKEYRNNNKPHLATLAAAARLTREYEITPLQWFKIYKRQAQLCPICLVKLNEYQNKRGKRAANVDHDHKTGRVRGLTCHACNRLRIGMNTVETAKRLVEYLASDFDGRSI